VFVFRYGIRLLLLVVAPSKWLGAARIVEQRKVLVYGSDHGDCEGFLPFPGEEPKGTILDCSWLV
jgi:hypothetical protein